MSEELLRLPSVRQRVGLSRATIYQLMKQGRFPKPIALGARAVAWQSSLIDAWIQEQIRAARLAGQQ